MRNAAGAEDKAAVHVFAPGRDGELSCRVLTAEGIRCYRCRDAADLQRTLTEETGALLLAEETLTPPVAEWLRSSVRLQPVWSDLPVIVVAQQNRHGLAQEMLACFGNVTILTRPMAVPDLISTTRSALRARQRQLQVRQLLAQQREEARRKDEFLAMLAHELRNPLSPVRYAAQALRAEASSPRALNLVEIIERQVGHMSRIITQLVDVTRLTRGMVALARAPLDLVELARRCVDARQSAARDRAVALDLQVQGPAWADADLTRMDQVIENLLDNAIKFSPSGSRVVVEVGARDGWAHIAVHDQGDGIAAEEMPYLFQPFVQADKSLDRARGGIGLGLTTVKALMELHGGRVSAQSEGPGRGSSFHVRLPSIAPPTKAAADAAQDEPSLAARGEVHVLLAEDNSDAAEVLCMLLQGFGYRVSVAASGPAAVDAARRERPDALLCDIGLPGMSGYEVARTLRTDPALADILMIAITGYGGREDRDAACEAGFNMHLAKPADPMLLLRELSKLEHGRMPANDESMRLEQGGS